MGKVIAVLSDGQSKAKVIKERGMAGYKFEAVGMGSLPFAIGLSHLQAKMIRKDNPRFMGVAETDIEEWAKITALVGD